MRSLPAGDGFADIVYLPKEDSPLPGLVVELKWNKTAKGAIDQIKAKRYPEAIRGCGGRAMLIRHNSEYCLCNHAIEPISVMQSGFTASEIVKQYK